ncbi:Oxygen-independent coproporphyrinogen-III oxidase [Aquimixticola soesokkakensis]|uniref:Coproporphyrinogen-III oxidase n=1 Tax=Aquimixticola soesokkakensis TaxID=1519096 RepID=A0A1Y5SV85_9RHOB|nr:oxygen-independent coproporphyrinogen III oxidase [Aquimixticola soesokkakensis]SLN47809.1 Oxygen-independent coproporphyrinogen-III oxidase [Aquimixticola soesokkakensis]
MTKHIQLRSLGLFDARVPRYTSYPTANHFSAGFKPERFADWLGALDPAVPVSLYVHVPFCRRLCWFCACRTQGTTTLSPVAAYVDTLKAELALVARHLPKGLQLGQMHWGGGTPTLLDAGMIGDLAQAVAQVLPFAKDAEFSVEIDPNEIDDARLDALAQAGMTRASIGVQDFDPAIQSTIGRAQSYTVTAQAVEGLRARGVRSLNADILYGLPEQTPAKMSDSVQKLLSLAPDRVALFGYAHVPWMARRQTMIPTDRLPDPEQRLALFDTARDLFVAAGYVEIGIDHFARPQDSLAKAQRGGRLRRNFQGYTSDDCPTLIGLGASSISRFAQGFAQNAPATSAYTQAIRAGRLASHKGHGFAGDDLLRARLIEALMCDFNVRLGDLDPLGVTAEQWQGWCATATAAFPEMLDVSARHMAILPHARPLTRMIARHFDAYDVKAAGHSSAV